MPLADTNQAAALTFDAAVHRALARRRSDTPYPHNGGVAPAPVATPPLASAGTGAGAAPAASATDAPVRE